MLRYLWILLLATAAIVFTSDQTMATQGKADAYFQARVKLKNSDALVEGKARFKKGQLEIYTGGRKRKYQADNIEFFEELDPLLPPSEERQSQAASTYNKKLELLKKDEASAWNRLGIWCRKKGLEKKAKEAFHKTLELDDKNLDAHRELNHVKDKGQWKDAALVAVDRWKAVKKDKLKALLKYGEWASKYRIANGQQALDKVLQKDFRNP